MNREVAKKWVAALRSGEYEQTTRTLKRGNGFCCLGVLCDLFRKEFGGEWSGEGLYGESGVLPSVVRNWAEMKRNNGEYDKSLDKPVSYPCGTLSADNDRGANFNLIANIIEQHVEEL